MGLLYIGIGHYSTLSVGKGKREGERESRSQPQEPTHSSWGCEHPSGQNRQGLESICGCFQKSGALFWDYP